MRAYRSRTKRDLLLAALVEEFDGRCAYCGTRTSTHPTIEHFVPLRKHPELAADPNNCLLACMPCNVSKAGSFPLDSAGTPLLINPRTESLSEHMQLENDGRLTATDERGEWTISVLNLNRPDLVARRRTELEVRSYFADFAANPPDAYETFTASMRLNRSLAEVQTDTDFQQQYLIMMLFANVVAATEAFLSDTLINAVASSDSLLRKFVESFHDFRNEKYMLATVFERHESIREHAVTALRKVIYHDLPKVAGIYEDTFGISFPRIDELQRAVLVRHDIVHRNGKSKDGNHRTVLTEEAEKLRAVAEMFVKEIQEKVRMAMVSVAKMPHQA